MYMYYNNMVVNSTFNPSLFERLSIMKQNVDNKMCHNAQRVYGGSK